MAGRAAEAALLSWAYALYTFDYRWALLGVPFGARLAFFERHWVRFHMFSISITCDSSEL